jgi:hypothetical protein
MSRKVIFCHFGAYLRDHYELPTHPYPVSRWQPAPSPKVDPQTIFQHRQLSAEADGPTAQPLQVRSQGQVLPLDVIDTIDASVVLVFWDQLLVMRQPVRLYLLHSRCQQRVDQLP